MTRCGAVRTLLDLQVCLTLVPWPPSFPSSPLYFWLSGLDEGPGEDIDPLKEPLGCSNGMLSSKFQPWDLPECPAGSAAPSLRDKTRDTFDQIENMDTVKQMAVPKSSRLLVEERPLVPPASSTNRVDKSLHHRPP